MTEEDERHLREAEGWYELGELVESSNALEEINPAHKIHPEVLQLRVLIYHKAGRLDYAAMIADPLAEHDPAIVGADICFDLACHCAREGALKAASVWLERAIEVENTGDMKLKALDHQDLKSLWEEIGKL